MKNILKAWLRKNELTPNPNDMMAVVSPVGKINKSGLIDAIMEEGIELKRETIEDIVTRYNRVAASFSARGWNVDTGLVYLRAIITGVFFGKKFDPEKNGIYVSATQGVEIRKELADTEVEILGEQADLMHIFQVINMQTKAADGTLTRGRNVEVEGSYLKLMGSDPSVGVYLENVDSGTEYKFEEEFIVINHPSKLMLLVPPGLDAGMYRLKVVTQFTGSNKLLTAPRQTVFGQELTVI
ncbi:MAG: DUF4469 domain-containing protein [Tannerella sp.]|jgi:hypothetical protein|nr:DUF4469 domain-containing protein [Tannerella sp.]